jgi:hypothetical protein
MPGMRRDAQAAAGKRRHTPPGCARHRAGRDAAPGFHALGGASAPSRAGPGRDPGRAHRGVPRPGRPIGAWPGRGSAPARAAGREVAGLPAEALRVAIRVGRSWLGRSPRRA